MTIDLEKLKEARVWLCNVEKGEIPFDVWKPCLDAIEHILSNNNTDREYLLENDEVNTKIAPISVTDEDRKRAYDDFNTANFWFINRDGDHEKQNVVKSGALQPETIETIRTCLLNGNNERIKQREGDIEVLKLQLAAKRSTDGNTGWMPIETAPKDGTIILRPHTIWGAMAVRHKRPDLESGIIPEGIHWLSSHYGQFWPDYSFHPYWQPLPASPVKDKGE